MCAAAAKPLIAVSSFRKGNAKASWTHLEQRGAIGQAAPCHRGHQAASLRCIVTVSASAERQTASLDSLRKQLAAKVYAACLHIARPTLSQMCVSCHIHTIVSCPPHFTVGCNPPFLLRRVPMPSSYPSCKESHLSLSPPPPLSVCLPPPSLSLSTIVLPFHATHFAESLMNSSLFNAAGPE